MFHAQIAIVGYKVGKIDPRLGRLPISKRLKEIQQYGRQETAREPSSVVGEPLVRPRPEVGRVGLFILGTPVGVVVES